VSARVRLRTVLAWSAVFAVAACNGIWGIDDGTPFRAADSSQAGQAGEPGGGASPDGARAVSGQGGEAGGSASGVAGAAGGDGGEGGEGGEASSGGVSAGGRGATGGSAGSMSGTGGGGAGPSCSGCKLNDTMTESRACGRCGTGSQTRTATCDANCTWQWSGWSPCSQCDTKNYRCCGAGKWEWCYDSDCAWTNDCAACAASSCPEC
jgi:hypothetical protein